MQDFFRTNKLPGTIFRTEIKKQLNLEITNGEPKYLYATGVYCIGFA